MFAFKRIFQITGYIVLVGTLMLFLVSQSHAGKNIPVKPGIRVIYPNGGEVWREGETHEIRWEANGVKRICISIGIGGKDKGLIVDDDCKIDARLGSVSWTVPRGFVTGFGISKANNARVLIFDPENPDISDFSDRYFTIEGSREGRGGDEHSVETTASDDFQNCIRSYFDKIIKKDYRAAYNMLSPCKIVLYDADGSGLAFQARGKFEAWEKDIKKFPITSLEKIKRIDTPGQAGEGSATAILGIRLYVISVKESQFPGLPSGNEHTGTFFVYVVKGTDNKVRILDIGTGP